MNYAIEYASRIASGDEVVSEKVAKVYERETAWMKHPPAEFPYCFDEAAGEKHIEFIEKFCKHSKGKFAQQPIKLELFQKAKIQMVFGWKEIETGHRRFREVVDIRGRKCGKSTETAAVEWDVFLNDREGGPEVYCTANKKDQANLIYAECVNMRTQSPELRAVTKKRQSDIYSPFNMGFIKCLAADTSTMDGLNPSFFSQDEFHAAKDSSLYDVMIQGQSMRDQPLAWLISTNGFVREGFFDQKYAVCSNIALWVPGYEDYTTLPLIYELNDRSTWADPVHWPEANPGLGVIKKYKTLADFVDKAKRDPSFLPTVMAKDFNLPENSFNRWLNYDEAYNDTVVGMEYLTRSYAIGGCDLSATTDLTCASLLIRKPNDKRLFILQKYFIPQSKLDKTLLSQHPEAPYEKWKKEGYLEVCEGATVDFHAVTEWFCMMVRVYNIRPLWIGYDAALSGYWVEEMTNIGFEMEKIRQGPFTWTYPMKKLHGLFEEHLVVYENNPMTLWCLLNTGVKSLNKDGIESQQPVKVSSVKRIDGTVSALNAYTCYEKHEDDYERYIR